MGKIFSALGIKSEINVDQVKRRINFYEISMLSLKTTVYKI